MSNEFGYLKVDSALTAQNQITKDANGKTEQRG